VALKEEAQKCSLQALQVGAQCFHLIIRKIKRWHSGGRHSRRRITNGIGDFLWRESCRHIRQSGRHWSSHSTLAVARVAALPCIKSFAFFRQGIAGSGSSCLRPHQKWLKRRLHVTFHSLLLLVQLFGNRWVVTILPVAQSSQSRHRQQDKAVGSHGNWPFPGPPFGLAIDKRKENQDRNENARNHYAAHDLQSAREILKLLKHGPVVPLRPGI